MTCHSFAWGILLQCMTRSFWKSKQSSYRCPLIRTVLRGHFRTTFAHHSDVRGEGLGCDVNHKSRHTQKFWGGLAIATRFLFDDAILLNMKTACTHTNWGGGLMRSKIYPPPNLCGKYPTFCLPIGSGQLDCWLECINWHDRYWWEYYRTVVRWQY